MAILMNRKTSKINLISTGFYLLIFDIIPLLSIARNNNASSYSIYYKLKKCKKAMHFYCKNIAFSLLKAKFNFITNNLKYNI
jgi:hypothetical protein